MSLCFLWKNRSLFLNCFFGGNLSQRRSFLNIMDRIRCILVKKVKFQKKSKISNFSKGFSPCFLSKNRTFSQMYFWDIKPEKIVSGYFKWKRFVFRPEKRTFKKVTKIEIHAFCQKINFFFMCIFHVYFCVNQARKDRFWIFQIQKNDFWAVNRTFKKFLKIEIFQRDQKKTTFIKIQNIEFFAKGLVHTFFQKIQLFLNRDFWANQARENHFLTFWIELSAF